MDTTPDYELTLVHIYDKPADRYCLFFAEIPEAIAQGRSVKEAVELLVPLAKQALEDRKEDILNNYLNNFDYKTSSYKLVHA